MANNAELEATLTYIRDNPEKHSQSSWFCGTTACFAGHTVLRHGWTFLHDHSATVLKDGLVGSVVPVAQEILGLTHQEAAALFMSAVSKDEVELVVKAIMNGEDPYGFMDGC